MVNENITLFSPAIIIKAILSSCCLLLVIVHSPQATRPIDIFWNVWCKLLIIIQRNKEWRMKTYNTVAKTSIPSCVIRQIGSQPLLQKLDALIFSGSVILNLIFAYFPHRKVGWLWMGEIYAGNGGRGVHGQGLGQLDATVLGGSHQAPHRLLL